MDRQVFGSFKRGENISEEPQNKKLETRLGWFPLGSVDGKDYFSDIVIWATDWSPAHWSVS